MTVTVAPPRPFTILCATCAGRNPSLLADSCFTRVTVDPQSYKVWSPCTAPLAASTGTICMHKRTFSGSPLSSSSLVTSAESSESLVSGFSSGWWPPACCAIPSTTGLASSRKRALCSIL